MKTHTLLLFLGVLAVTGCAHVNNVMSSWVGHNYADLIMSWGPPQAVFDDGQGGRIFVYTQKRQWTRAGTATTTTTGTASVYGNRIWVNAQSFTSYRPPEAYGYTAWRLFRANARGIIYEWRWKGL